MDCFVEQDWLQAIVGKDFFYPAAYMDIAPFVSLLAPYVTQFVCNDPNYDTRSDRHAPVPAEYRLVRQNKLKPASRDRRLLEVTDTRIPYHDLTPSVLEQVYTYDGAEITIVRQKSYGQYALLERPEHSIGAFVHRWDSTGEGGSDVWFLANRHKEHEPLSNLWDKLSVRLADRALVISDGSLTTFKFLDCPSGERFLPFYEAQRRKAPFQYAGFLWQCAGYMNDRGGTLIWGLSRL